MADLGRADAPQQRPDARRQLLRHERLGEVVVGACLEPGDDVVGVVAGGHHHDRHVAVTTDRAAQLEPVDARQHDVDQHDVGALALERLDGGLARRHALDRPALVLEGQLHAPRGSARRPQRPGFGCPYRHHDAGFASVCSVTVPRPLAATGRQPAPATSARRASNTPGAATSSSLGTRRATGEVTRAAPRFAGDQLAGGHVPRVEVLLVVGVDEPGGGVAQVDGRRADAADVAHVAERAWRSEPPGARARRGRSRSRWRRARATGRPRRSTGSAGRCAWRPRRGRRRTARRSPARTRRRRARRARRPAPIDVLHSGQPVEEVGGAVDRVDVPRDRRWSRRGRCPPRRRSRRRGARRAGRRRSPPRRRGRGAVTTSVRLDFVAAVTSPRSSPASASAWRPRRGGRSPAATGEAAGEREQTRRRRAVHHGPRSVLERRATRPSPASPARRRCSCRRRPRRRRRGCRGRAAGRSRRRTAARRGCSRSARRPGRRGRSPTKAAMRTPGDGSAESGRGRRTARAEATDRRAAHDRAPRWRPAQSPGYGRGVLTVAVVPTYNEVDNLEALLRADPQGRRPASGSLVVDDASTDGTPTLAHRLADELGGVAVVDRAGTARPRVGVPGRASRRRSARGADVCVQIDADLSHDPAVLPALLANVEHGADLAIGSRYVPGGITENWPCRRRLLSRWGNRYAAGLLGLAVNDATAGYRAYRSEALERIRFDTVGADGYGFQIEMTHRLVRAGGRIVEFPITFRDRRAGESKMSRGIVREAARLVLALWFAGPPRSPPAAAAHRLTRHRSTLDRCGQNDGAWSGASSCTSTWTRSSCRSSCAAGPSSRGQPVVVGGTGRRGVVAAASYEARRYGVHSAMPSVQRPAAVSRGGVPPRRPRRRTPRRAPRCSTSSTAFTPLVEPLSLDEAFLDVTGAGSPVRRRGRRSAGGSATVVDAELDLSCSVGVAPNKFLAKMASVEAKPRARPEGVAPGPRRVRGAGPGSEIAYLHPLPVAAAVGRRAGHARATQPARRRHDRRPHHRSRRSRCGRRSGRPTPSACVDLAGGHDDRPVEPERAVKSVEPRGDVRHTTSTTSTRSAREIVRLCRRRRRRASGRADLAARTITVKVRDAVVPHGHAGPRRCRRPLDTAAGHRRRRHAAGRGRAASGAGVRLLGVAASKFSEPAEQLQLSGLGAESDGEPPWGAASRAIDRVRGRFGAAAIGPASTLSSARAAAGAPRRSSSGGPTRRRRASPTGNPD